MKKLSMLFCAMQIISPAIAATKSYQTDSSNITAPSIPLDAISSRNCGVDLLRPPIIAGVGCAGVISEEGNAGLTFTYFQYLIQHNDFRRSIDIDLRAESINDYVEKGAGRLLLVSEESNALVRTSEGTPVLSELNELGDCGQERHRKIMTTTIQGKNWNGWLFEQSFPAPQKVLKNQCKMFTPAYRCVSIIFGNDRYSASMPSRCFLRKMVGNIDNELSYDIFINMINSIKFKKGTILASKRD